MESNPQDQLEGSKSADEPASSPSGPLVPLHPAQKRQAKDPSPPPKRPSVFKSPRTNEVLKPVARHAYNPWLSDPSPGMRERHSAPGDIKHPALAELRGSKSAPDLRAPILATIRGLQDGSIQVDQQTRAKIAHAARRVLEAREFRRRTSQEAYQSQGTAMPSDSASTRPSTDVAQQAAGRSEVGSMEGQHMQASRAIGALGISSWGAAKPDVENAELGKRLVEEQQDNVLLSRFGDTQAGRTSPFTVTTGVPRFSQGTVTEGSQLSSSPAPLKQARTRSSPIPVMPATQSTSHASLPRSLDFVSGLGQADSELGQAADYGKAP